METDKWSPKIDLSSSLDTASLKGKTVLITGGATGIGQGCAIALAEAGAYVTIADINETDGNDTAGQLTDQGLHAQFIKTDVTSWPSLIAAFKASLAFSPNHTLDILIPSAGVGNSGQRSWIQNPPLDANGDPEPPSTRVLDINMMAVYNTVYLALHHFRHNPGPSSDAKTILLVASMGGFTSMTGVLDYCGSKWGVRGIFRALRGARRILGEGHPDLRVNLLAPTFVKTNMTKGYWEYMEKAGLSLAEVSDCVDVAMRLCADEGVHGRAVAVAANGKSFDLQDDSEGLDAGTELKLAITENRFGYVKPEKPPPAPTAAVPANGETVA
ncbi:NAD(P)-binding protein [Trichodelitschia bisporula]|uniref:NAD(P)-binding protein n=1 Tax=Trichodelitschia bisporula TaxID=703511 RepID=A0A6G1HY24_9PEZI|nr:NAD(P)-binding protein [Trichodelitschia bisporula]